MTILLEAFAIVHKEHGTMWQDTAGSNGIYTTRGRAQAVINKKNPYYRMPERYEVVPIQIVVKED